MLRPTPRLNNTALTETTCHRCRLPILTGWDDTHMAQQVQLHPALINHTNATAALHLGHPVTAIQGSHQTGFRASHTWHPNQLDYLIHTRSERGRNFMVWHTCHLPQLNYQPIPAPREPTEEFDLFNQEPAPPF